MSNDLWKKLLEGVKTTEPTWQITYIPVVSNYKTVTTDTPEALDKQVMELITDGWCIHGLPQTTTIQGKTKIMQGMVKYENEPQYS